MVDQRKRDNPNHIILCGTLYVDMCIKKNSFTYCETHKTVNTRNIYGMLFCYGEIANNVWEN